jgi:hypothetical protein
MYQSGPGYYRVASKPAAEARMWMIAGIAGGIEPWWHHVGAYHEDRRMYHTAEPVMRWWAANERYLIDRQPVADVGLVWSQRSTDFFGREEAAERVDAPYTGFMHALVRARIPYLPVHVDQIAQIAERQPKVRQPQVGQPSASALNVPVPNVRVLILPNVGALSDAQAAAIRRFVQQGGSLIATGQTGLYDEWGDPRADFALADLFRAHQVGETPRLRAQTRTRATDAAGAASGGSAHTYLRLSPELRARVDGPKTGDEPPIAGGGERHPVLEGFDETDILPYGGTLSPLRVDATAIGPTVPIVPLTLVPAFPTYPPETSWMRTPKTDIPGLILSQPPSSDPQHTARVAFMPADIDRRYAREHLPDHARLLANVIRWAAAGHAPVTVEGPGLIDCHLYEQPGRLILHLVNLTSEAAWRAPLDELIRVGPFTVRIRLPHRSTPFRAHLRVAGTTTPARRAEGAAGTSVGVVEIPSLLDHELIVIE